MLRAQNLCWHKNEKAILEHIQFELHPGECLGLIGPNGSGKSSLLKILAFLEPPTSGELWFQGQTIPKLAPLEIRRKIAIAFQDALLLNTSVWENIAIGLKIRSVPKSEIRERVNYWLQQFGIVHLAKQPARSLSGGEAQRVSLARALVLNPNVLFLDEPFSALDAPTKESLRTDLVKIFHSTQVTTVIVSHDFEDIERLTQRALILIQGQIVADAEPATLLATPQTPEVDQFLSYWRNTRRLNSISDQSSS
ncbi:ABC transporter ATP-binding protein [Desulfitobacterium metallireducens]|uniref:ABC transporter n=1 Tax=Desulfitobacterium metallireducens DSM 15288 TaxID=871968 RepID=W0E4Q9_9FIRM|nr:ATP-binding cassette domain-containing protein [Desulfitobacterium metallireducens]AHF05845.1 ABC transporter [Desulfitobacterium metallireducens DSM 15288]